MVLESGRFDVDEDAQTLSEGPVASTHHLAGALREGRRRQFGGSTNLWLHRTDPDDGRRHAPDAAAGGVRSAGLAARSIDAVALLRARPSHLPAGAVVVRHGPMGRRGAGALAIRTVHHRRVPLLRERCVHPPLSRRHEGSEHVTVVQNATAVGIDADGRSTISQRSSRVSRRTLVPRCGPSVRAGGRRRREPTPAPHRGARERPRSRGPAMSWTTRSSASVWSNPPVATCSAPWRSTTSGGWTAPW